MDLRLSTPAREAEEVLSGILKITQRGIEVMSRYSNLSLSPSVSHTTEASTSFENKV